MEATNLGTRLKTLRRQRRMSQEELARVSGIAVTTIRKIEQGQRKDARLQTIAALAAALTVAPAELLGVQPGLPGKPADVARLRTAIYDRSAGDAEPPSLDELRSEVMDLRSVYWHAQYAMLADQLPAHLTAVRAAVRAANGDDARRSAHAVLAESLQLAASLVTQFAYEDLAHVALIQATAAADVAEDPLLRAAQHSATAWVLSRQGLWTQAQDLALTAAREIEPVISRATPEELALWGELLHFGMVALAREGRTDEAHQLLALVQAAGHAIGATAPTKYKLPFSSTWAEHSAVQLHQATDQPKEALRAAQRVERPETLPPSVHARFLLNTAWALMLTWRSEEALDALRKIEHIAPELLERHGLARAIVEELMPRRRTLRLPGLVGLAERIGVVQ